jgi:hypothetical protein
MIVYVSRNGPPEAMMCPVFLCDHCREPIQGREGGCGYGGLVIWRHDHEGTRPVRQELATVHKGPCHRAYEAAHPGERWLSEEFGVFVQQLAHNSAEPFPDEPNVEYLAPAPSQWRKGRYHRAVTRDEP